MLATDSETLRQDPLVPETDSEPSQAGDASHLLGEEGFVRENDLHVTLRLPDLAPRTIAVVFKGDGEVQRTKLTWPRDFASLGEEANPLSRTATVPISASAPFDQVVVASRGMRSEASPGWHLRGLFAHSKNQFERHFFRHRNRIRHAGTLVFSLRQILDHYHLDEAHRAVAAVIYGYRAADSCNPEFLADAKVRLRDQLNRSGLLVPTGNARTDRDHLHLSMLMVLWHVELELGDFDAVFATLDEATAYSLPLPEPMAAIAYNSCRMIFLRGMFALWEGEIERGRSLLLANFHFYVKCMKRAEPNATRFTEMMDAHKAVALSLQNLERLAANKKNLERPVVFAAVNRVRSDHAAQFLGQRMEEMARLMRKRR